MSTSRRVSMSRRSFLAQTASATALSVTAASVVTASKSDSRPTVGEGAFRYEAIHDWPQLPAPYQWQTTHGVTLGHAECNEGSLFLRDPSRHAE